MNFPAMGSDYEGRTAYTFMTVECMTAIERMPWAYFKWFFPGDYEILPNREVEARLHYASNSSWYDPGMDGQLGRGVVKDFRTPICILRQDRWFYTHEGTAPGFGPMAGGDPSVHARPVVSMGYITEGRQDYVSYSLSNSIIWTTPLGEDAHQRWTVYVAPLLGMETQITEDGELTTQVYYLYDPNVSPDTYQVRCLGRLCAAANMAQQMVPKMAGMETAKAWLKPGAGKWTPGARPKN
jgi:hypothetical protein